MIAVISAWNTGHPVSRTRFCPRPMISPSLTITAPNGPPQPFSTDSIASRVASSMNLRSIAIIPVCVVPSRRTTIARVHGRMSPARVHIEVRWAKQLHFLRPPDRGGQLISGFPKRHFLLRELPHVVGGELIYRLRARLVVASISDGRCRCD